MIAFSKNRIGNMIAFLEKKGNIVFVEKFGFLSSTQPTKPSVECVSVAHKYYKFIIINKKKAR